MVTGGVGTDSFVTEYHLVEGTETPLTSMGQPRFRHACGVYLDADDQQVSKRLEEKTNTKIEIEIHKNKEFTRAQTTNK